MSAIEQNREITLTRVFNAPASVLFEAYSKPEHIKRWFGPVGYPVTTAKIDFRVGGSFWFQMTGPTGELNTPFGGTYLEIVPDRLIRYDNGFLEPPGGERMIVTITFDELGDGQTALIMHTVFESRGMYVGHVGGGFEAGTQSGFDQLADLARELAAR